MSFLLPRNDRCAGQKQLHGSENYGSINWALVEFAKWRQRKKMRSIRMQFTSRWSGKSKDNKNSTLSLASTHTGSVRQLNFYKTVLCILDIWHAGKYTELLVVCFCQRNHCFLSYHDFQYTSYQTNPWAENHKKWFQKTVSWTSFAFISGNVETGCPLHAVLFLKNMYFACLNMYSIVATGKGVPE